MAGHQVPFRFITGLPIEAQKEIERDFADIVSQINTTPTVFDAIIDPSLSAKNTTTHEYPNLTQLLANESWAVYKTFIVGVRQRNNPQIVEPTSPLSITTKGDLALFGIGATTLTDSNHKGWDWAVITANSTQQISYYNLSFQPYSGGG